MLEEEERLKQLLIVQQEQVQADFRGIKEELRPITNFGHTAKKFLTRKGGQALTTLSIKLLVDGVVKNFILSKAGWFTRFVVPFFLKNYGIIILTNPVWFFDCSFTKYIPAAKLLILSVSVK